jgi:propanol-preferring alcohol dehydrogenase
VIPGHQIVGEVVRAGEDVHEVRPGDRVGIAWLHQTCGICRFCRSGRENLCDASQFTGWSVDGGYAEYVKAPGAFVYRLPDGFADLQAAPLLCAGIIGYRCLRLCGIQDWSGARLGIYGFGAAGHIAIQIARARGAEVYVCTRDRTRHQKLAEELGAAWVGEARAKPPQALDASIIFAPAGELVPPALEALERGGSLVLGGIHMSDIPSLPYEALYQERLVRSVANNTREDGRDFLVEAARLKIETSVHAFPLEDCNRALDELKNDAIRGAAVVIP